MPTCTTTTAQQTQECAEKFAHNVHAKTVYAFFGDLGAGKTTFIQGALKALGAEKPFPSPTFTIVNTYYLSQQSLGYINGIHTIYHMDAYRITDNDVASVGWQEMCADHRGIIFLEWPENISQNLPKNTKHITIINRNNVREITLP